MTLIISAITLLVCTLSLLQVQCNKDDLKVLFAINAGGYDHTDKNGIQYDADFLTEGIASDYGNHLLIIGRVPEQDEVLYKTERYHTSTFGYDLPLEGDGQYALVLKFCEVYFNKPNKKIFDVILNRKHEIVSQLDIYAQVGRGTAHDEYVFFNVVNGKLLYKGQTSEVRQNRVRLDFIKGPYDNPKINAFVLFKGNVERIPRLKPLNNDAIKGRGENVGISGRDKMGKVASRKSKQLAAEDLHLKKALFEDDDDDDEDDDDDVEDDADADDDANDNDLLDTEAVYPKQSVFSKHIEEDADIDDDEDDDEFSSLLSKSDHLRKPSGPRQPDPYSMDDSTPVLLPVFIAIGAFIPLLFCLCKL